MVLTGSSSKAPNEKTSKRTGSKKVPRVSATGTQREFRTVLFKPAIVRDCFLFQCTTDCYFCNQSVNESINKRAVKI